MDKKQLMKLVESIVTAVAEKNGMSEAEARTFVGVAIRNNQEALIGSIATPTFAVSK